MPKAPPTMSAIRGARMATVREMRAPWINRASMSRPSRSVPSQCTALGGARRSSMSMSVGLGSGSTSASVAASTIKKIQPSASQNSQPNLARPAHTSAVASAARNSAALLVRMADPGVEHGVEHVDQEIDDHESGRHEQHDALQDHEIPGVDGAQQ